MFEFYDDLQEALAACKHTQLVVIDGPEDNYAVVDLDTARDIQETEDPITY